MVVAGYHLEKLGMPTDIVCRLCEKSDETSMVVPHSCVFGQIFVPTFGEPSRRVVPLLNVFSERLTFGTILDLASSLEVKLFSFPKYVCKISHQNEARCLV